MARNIPGVASVFSILYSDPMGLVSVILGVGSSDPRGVASVILGGGTARHPFQSNFAISWCMAYRQ